MKNLFFILIVLAFINCKSNTTDFSSEAIKIQVSDNPPTQYLSDFFKLDGFILLEESGNSKIRSDRNTKLVFIDNKLLVLDNMTEFQDVWVFDKSDGKYSGKIGFQNENDENGYDGLNDIAYNKSDNFIRFCSSAKMHFMDYSADGMLQSTQSSGIIGEETEWLSNGKEMVVYNELNANDISGSNYLIFYDRQGNLLKKSLPYSPDLNGYGYTFTGFLSKSGKHLFFAPPFSDTLFEILSKDQITPRYILDFGSLSIPENIRNKRIYGENVHDNAYLSNQCIQVGKFLIFEYFHQGIVSLGLYDTTNNMFMDFNHSKKDALYDLLQLGELTSVDDNTFAFAISPARLKNLIKNNSIDEPMINSLSVGLWEKIQQGSRQDKNMLILYFKVSPDAAVAGQ